MAKNGFEYGVLPIPGANGISPSRKHILHLIISTFWIIGMILTAQNIHKNYSRYLDYPKIVQTKEEHGVSKSYMNMIKLDASSRWSFGPNSAWGSITTMTIGKTHPTL